MQERIIIEIPKDMCDNCNSCDKPTSAQIECYLEEPRQVYETVKVPETFADVKQLTKELIEKVKLNKDVWEINIQEHFIDIQKMYVTYRVRFTDIGNILFDSYLKIAENKTPAQMWRIIKDLIGEE